MLRLLFTFLVAFSIQAVSAQGFYINGISTQPVPATNCDDLLITVTGDYPCGNTMFNNTSFSIVGSTINVRVNVTQPGICTPVLVPYSHTVNVGMLASGNYVINAQYWENGVMLQNAA